MEKDRKLTIEALDKVAGGTITYDGNYEIEEVEHDAWNMFHSVYPRMSFNYHKRFLPLEMCHQAFDDWKETGLWPSTWNPEPFLEWWFAEH